MTIIRWNAEGGEMSVVVLDGALQFEMAHRGACAIRMAMDFRTSLLLPHDGW